MRIENSGGGSGLAVRAASPARPLARPSLRAFRHVVGGYYLTFGRLPNLVRPRLFSEKVQWRKLFDRNPVFALLSDKIAVRDFIAARVGPGRTPRVLWVGATPEDIPFDRLEPPYAVKCTHRSGLNVLVKDRAHLDPDAARAQLRAAFNENYGETHYEPGYAPVPRRVLAEELVTAADGGPAPEHFIHIFGGRAGFIETNVYEPRRDGCLELRAQFCDRDWRPRAWREDLPPVAHPLPPPAHAEEMIALAETLAAGFDYLRVDIYESARPVVGELSLYANSGYMVYRPTREVEEALGALWRLERPFRRALAAWLLP